MASRVPEPIDGCAVRNASPIKTIFLTCQFSLSTRRQRRQIERLLISGFPPSVSANTRLGQRAPLVVRHGAHAGAVPGRRVDFGDECAHRWLVAIVVSDEKRRHQTILNVSVCASKGRSTPNQAK